jgi:hypothetical protein
MVRRRFMGELVNCNNAIIESGFIANMQNFKSMIIFDSDYFHRLFCPLLPVDEQVRLQIFGIL